MMEDILFLVLAMEPRVRASPEQFSILLDYMERHGDLSRPQQGPQGRIKSERMWNELANTLNSLGGGVIKSPDKWKKVWADWKTKTKKKYLTLRRQATRTGGGPSNRLILTALEERVVAIIGVSAVVGQAGIEEHGFNITSNEPGLDLNEMQVSASALEVDNQNVHNIMNLATPGSSGIHNLSQQLYDTNVSAQATSASTPIFIPSPPPRTPSPPPLTPTPAPRTQAAPRAPMPPRTPPPRNNRQLAADSPRSTATTPRRALLRARRNRGLTPFERASQEFASIERRRLEHEEARDKRLHERDMESLRLEAERLRMEAQRTEVAKQHNQLLHQLCVLGQHVIDVISQQRQLGSLPSTDPI
ncbi:uncharacterized protein LOC142975663 [Anticarsia gemmatalis]|uniref:uncharacterized protein LOC142975663 n=1 Tax=Anticarsia gemmatalis TaxID=129554 RepID=UPI003F759FFE